MRRHAASRICVLVAMFHAVLGVSVLERSASGNAAKTSIFSRGSIQSRSTGHTLLGISMTLCVQEIDMFICQSSKTLTDVWNESKDQCDRADRC